MKWTTMMLVHPGCFLLGMYVLAPMMESDKPANLLEIETARALDQIEQDLRWDKELDILLAMCDVESGGVENPPDGDGGDSIGPLQIQRDYWYDAVEFSGLDVTYQDCRKLYHAMKVVEEYMKRYCPEAWENLDYETIARTHNGGPKGPSKSSTEAYWEKVQVALENRNG
jgi:hypothetical protein